MVEVLSRPPAIDDKISKALILGKAVPQPPDYKDYFTKSGTFRLQDRSTGELKHYWSEVLLGYRYDPSKHEIRPSWNDSSGSNLLVLDKRRNPVTRQHNLIASIPPDQIWPVEGVYEGTVNSGLILPLPSTYLPGTNIHAHVDPALEGKALHIVVFELFPSIGGVIIDPSSRRLISGTFS